MISQILCTWGAANCKTEENRSRSRLTIFDYSKCVSVWLPGSLRDGCGECLDFQVDVPLHSWQDFPRKQSRLETASPFYDQGRPRPQVESRRHALPLLSTRPSRIRRRRKPGRAFRRDPQISPPPSDPAPGHGAHESSNRIQRNQLLTQTPHHRKHGDKRRIPSVRGGLPSPVPGAPGTGRCR